MHTLHTDGRLHGRLHERLSGPWRGFPHGHLRRLGRRLVLLALLLLCAQLALAQSWRAATLPQDGNLGGPAGSLQVWGYDIANDDGALWLVTTSVSADPFEHASPLSFFDFPIVAPGRAATIPAGGAFGLFGIVWDAGAPLGFVNSGSFLLTAEWWSGDPLAGGSYVSAADSISLDYSALVTSVPEPALPLMLGAGLALLCVARRHVWRGEVGGA